MQDSSRIFAFIGAPLRSTLVASLIFVPIWIGASVASTAQEAVQGTELAAVATTPTSPIVPQQVRYAGKLATRAGDSVEAVFRIYAAAEGSDPLWTETQRLTVSEDGSYSVLLGGASSSGLPQSVFAGGAARWLGVSVERSPEQERVLLSSVPYAMKSADAESLSGHAVSDFVTQGQLAQLVQLAQSAQSATQSSRQGAAGPEVQPNTSGTITGSGTANTFPIFTGTNTIGNSVLTQSGSNFGINYPDPLETLDVGGTLMVHGTGTFPPLTLATTSHGQPSNTLNFEDSVWSTTTNAPVVQSWILSGAQANNNTANPGSNFRFQYQDGVGTPISTLLTIANTGVITFAPAQTFPGTIASVTAASPVTAATTSGAVSLGLNTSALETTLNTVYPQLATADNFSQSVEAHQTAGPGHEALEGIGASGSIGVLGTSDTGYGVKGTSTSGMGMLGIVTAPVASSAGVLGATGITSSVTYGAESGVLNAGVWADSSGAGTGIPAALVATTDIGYSGVFHNDTSAYPGVQVVNENGTGISSYDSVPGIQQGAVIGVDGTSNSTEFGTYYLTSGVWGDTSVSSTSSLFTAGLLGTADNSFAGLFYNHSASYPTIFVQNDGTAGTGLFTTIKAVSAKGACGVGGNGDLTCTGQVKTLARTGGGARTVETYAMQSPENWMEDFGSGQLHQGVSVVTIDATFAETVSGTADYHVFLTPKGDSKGLYVINETATSFEVRESGGGTSSLAFDYRIVAKRRGYEAERLTDVTERFNAESKATMPTKPVAGPRSASPQPFALKRPGTLDAPRGFKTVHPTAPMAALQQEGTTKP